MALAISNLTSGGSGTAGATFTTASISPSNGDLLLLFANVANSPASAKADIPSISGNNLTWNLIHSGVYFSVGNRRLSLFYAIADSGVSSGTVTINHTSSQTAAIWTIERITGFDTATPISWLVQCLQAGPLTSTTPTVTLGALQDTNSLSVGFLVTGANTAGTAVGSGFTQLSEVLQSGTTINSEYKVNDATVTWTTTSAAYGAIALEITAANAGGRNNPLAQHLLGACGAGS